MYPLWRRYGRLGARLLVKSPVAADGGHLAGRADLRVGNSETTAHVLNRAGGPGRPRKAV